MRTNIELDDKLLRQLMKFNPNLKTKKDAVNFAMWSTVQRQRDLSWDKLVKSRPLDPGYDYKAARGGG